MNKLNVCVFAFFSIAIYSTQVFSSPCGEVLYNKHGMLGTYRYANLNITEGSKKFGYTSWSSGVSTENTTAVTDPGVTTGASTYTKQVLSTVGECKWFGLVYIQEKRKEFIAQNIEVLKNELAFGQGEFSKILLSSYACDSNATESLAKSIQQNYQQKNFSKLNAELIDHEIISIIQTSPEEFQTCGTSKII